MGMASLLFRNFSRVPGANSVLRVLFRINWVRTILSNIIVNRFANSTNPRPRPISLFADYTSWRSLTDKNFTGRHLPPDDGKLSYPPIHDVVDLWRREENKEIPSFDTSMLFSFFAQWFTDSFLRTNLFEREKNFSNHEIDFCQLYGMKPEQTAILRLNEGGKLKFQTIDGEVYPPFLFDPEKTTENEWVFKYAEFENLHDRNKLEFIFQKTPIERLKHVFATGLEHGNSNVGYVLLNTIALREHNRICDELAKANPDWATDDERLFQVARNINTVLLLRIVVGDYVKHISSIDFPFTVEPGMAEKQEWYRSNWITIEFNLLYRWHSMVPDKLVVNGNEYAPDEFKVNSGLLLKHGVESMVTSASKQLAGKIGLQNTPRFFFDTMPLVHPDTGAIDNRSIQERTVQMGRDARLKSLNDYREAFGLERLTSFRELTGDEDLANKLEGLYKHIDNLEWHTGIFAEKHEPGAMLGQLMTTMVAYDAFTHALTNPLLSKHVFNEETFSKRGLEIIEATNTFSDYVKHNLTEPGETSVSFNARRQVPGSYGLPVIGGMLDLIAFTASPGWKKFFQNRKQKNASTVYKVNLFQPTVVVQDWKGFKPFHSWDGSLKKDFGFGWAIPPLALTGGDVPSVFLANPEHQKFKSLYMTILKNQSSSLQTTFEKTFGEFAEKWESAQQFKWAEELERLAASFVYDWYFGERPDIDKLRYVYNNIFLHIPLWLQKLLPWSAYNRSLPISRDLKEFVLNSKKFADFEILAEKQGLSGKEDLANQLLFLTGMNNFLGLQGMSKALVGELSKNPGLTDDLRQEIQEAEENCGGNLDISDIAGLKKMDRFLKEVMRLHPPVFFIYGRAKDDFLLESASGCFVIEKDTHMMAVIPVAQTDPEIFGGPETFNPDRFQNNDLEKYLIWPHGEHNAAVDPAGHVCPGKDVAMLYGKMLCYQLIPNFSWQLVSPPEWDDRKFSLNVASPKGDMQVERFSRRASSN